MTKVRYEIDPHNRLVAAGAGEGLRGFRYVLDGRYSIGKGNTLAYHIKTPPDYAPIGLRLPRHIRLRGSWSLADGHNLKLTLSKWQKQKQGELTLQSELVSSREDSVIFAITQKTADGGYKTSLLKLEGVWQADRDNRITFRVKRHSGPDDLLVFDGIWEISRQHQIAYTYESRDVVSGGVKKHGFLFRGFWDISKRNAITYLLGAGGGSAFDFRIGGAAVEKDRIKFDVGIGLSGRSRPVRRHVVLYGKWRLEKGKGLVFEINYPVSGRGAIEFAAEATLEEMSKVRVSLFSIAGKKLGLQFYLAKDIFRGSGQAFLELLRNSEEKAVRIGAGVTW